MTLQSKIWPLPSVIWVVPRAILIRFSGGRRSSAGGRGGRAPSSGSMTGVGSVTEPPASRLRHARPPRIATGRLEGRDDVQAVALRQMEIHEHDGVMLLPQCLERLLAVIDDVNPVSALGEEDLRRSCVTRSSSATRARSARLLRGSRLPTLWRRSRRSPSAPAEACPRSSEPHRPSTGRTAPLPGARPRDAATAGKPSVEARSRCRGCASIGTCRDWLLTGDGKPSSKPQDFCPNSGLFRLLLGK